MRSTRRAALAAVSALVLLPAGAALAHTPYLLPNAFDAERDRVTLEAALSEDDYFRPDIALGAPSYVVTQPSGAEVNLPPTAKLRDVALVEVPLEAPGTYRISTRGFAGRKSILVNVNGKWLMVRQPRGGRPAGEGPGEGRRLQGAPAEQGPGASARNARPAGGLEGGEGPPSSIAEADVPAGAQRMESEQMMLVETYVSKGAPTDAALKTTGQGFELKPGSHPNAIYVDQGFAFQLLVDGKPVAGAPISVYRSGNIYDDKRIAVETKSDGQGMAKIAFALPGVYMLTTRYPVAQRKPGEAPPPRSYTYSLTFEVTR